MTELERVRTPSGRTRVPIVIGASSAIGLELARKLITVVTGCDRDSQMSWGLRPRLYAYACSAG